VGKNRIGKGGVVKNPLLHDEVTLSLSQFFETIGFLVHGIVPSPITGPKGNKEFLCYMKNKS
jgi:23S rRNA (cytidine1920-2'-O)/16S rRNA (cytidine1409-2'-O)-methyltransferase